MNKENEQRNILTLPALAMRGLLVFPKMTLSIDVERSSSVQAAELAASGDHLVFMVMQKNLEDDDPKPDNIHTVGTVCRVRQMLRQLNQGYSRLIVEGLYRAEAVKIEEQGGIYYASVQERPNRKERIPEIDGRIFEITSLTLLPRTCRSIRKTSRKCWNATIRPSAFCC